MIRYADRLKESNGVKSDLKRIIEELLKIKINNQNLQYKAINFKQAENNLVEDFNNKG